MKYLHNKFQAWIAIQSRKCFASNKMNLLTIFLFVSAMIAGSIATPKSAHLSSPKPEREITSDDALKLRFGNQTLFAQLNANTRYDIEQVVLQSVRCVVDCIDNLSQKYDFVELWKPYKQAFTHYLNIMENCPDKKCFERELDHMNILWFILLTNLEKTNPHTCSVVLVEVHKECFQKLNF